MFEALTWQLDKYPLSVIRGRNLDAKVITSNRVGKSLLPSTLTTLLTDAPPVALKKKSAKELVKNKAQITLELNNHGKDYQIKQLAHGKSVKYAISINKIAQEIKDIKVARQLIQTAVPLSPDHIFSQLYISSYRPSVLLYGSAPTRLNYFEQVFDLRIYDQLRKSVLEQLQVVNKDFLEANILKQNKLDLQPALKHDVTNKLNKIRRQHADILTEYNRAHTSAQKLTAYVTLAEQIQTEKTYQQLKTDVKIYQKQITDLKQKLNQAQKFNSKAEQAREQIQQRLKIKRQLAKLSYQPVHNQLVKVQQKIRQLENKIKDYHRYEPHIERYRKVINKYQHKIAQPVTQLQQKLSQLKFQLKQQKQLKNKSHCPLCQQKLPHNQHHSYYTISKKINKTKVRVKHAKIIDYINKVQQKIPQTLLVFDINNKQQKLAKLRDKFNDLQLQSEINQQYQEIKQKLRALPKPGTTKKVKDLQKYEQKLEHYQQQLYRAQNDLKLLAKLAEMDNAEVDFKSAKKLLEQERLIVSQLNPQLENISEQLDQLIQQNSDYQSAYKQLTKLEHKLSRLEKNIKDRDILEALAKAYSTKGIRLLQVQALAETYINTLNRFGSFIYSEPVNFFSEVAPGKFDILAERGGNISDVRYFSGAESRQFMALSALALISLMPNQLRCNLVVLDELEAGLFEVDRKKFATQFLPLMQQYINNLVIITPMLPEQFFIPEAKELLLIKERRNTTWK